jgi:hypothetical protein
MNERRALSPSGQAQLTHADDVTLISAVPPARDRVPARAEHRLPLQQEIRDYVMTVGRPILFAWSSLVGWSRRKGLVR